MQAPLPWRSHPCSATCLAPAVASPCATLIPRLINQHHRHPRPHTLTETNHQLTDWAGSGGAPGVVANLVLLALELQRQAGAGWHSQQAYWPAGPGRRTRASSASSAVSCWAAHTELAPAMQCTALPHTASRSWHPGAATMGAQQKSKPYFYWKGKVMIDAMI